MAIGTNLSRKKDALFPEKSKKAKKSTSKKNAVKKLGAYRISDSVTIANVVKVVADINENLKKVKELSIEIDSVEVTDLTFLQLLIALKKDNRIQLDLKNLDTEKLNQLGFYKLH